MTVAEGNRKLDVLFVFSFISRFSLNSEILPRV